ncbi:hypothetical protein TIFTF001_001361 [Ficus carica]|uniref:Protein kinase domain-containing protein n=1 Tax=Ficus carica TaxID=3494 RepID=A0AA87ZFJ4_FICCA|nr:hypothetical protein TIFTF001_001361 [Ficus carica]
MMDQSHTLTSIRGTKGYVAPELFRNLPITAKVDVYSFGVVLLETICCRRSVDVETCGKEKEILTDWAYDCFQEGNLDVLVECEIEGLDDRKNLERVVMVAIWCIQESPSVRPDMGKVVRMLEGVTLFVTLLIFHIGRGIQQVLNTGSDCFKEGTWDVLVNWESEALNDIKTLETEVKVSMWCVQENPSFRPAMRKVVLMLEGVIEVEVPPCLFPYSVTK